jgi:hypothetical protein
MSIHKLGGDEWEKSMEGARKNIREAMDKYGPKWCPMGDEQTQVELLARRMCWNKGFNPDQMVIPGDPHYYMTPMGRVIEAVQGAPLWTFWELEANVALKFLGQCQRQPDSKPP